MFRIALLLANLACLHLARRHRRTTNFSSSIKYIETSSPLNTLRAHLLAHGLPRLNTRYAKHRKSICCPTAETLHASRLPMRMLATSSEEVEDGFSEVDPKWGSLRFLLDPTTQQYIDTFERIAISTENSSELDAMITSMPVASFSRQDWLKLSRAACSNGHVEACIHLGKTCLERARDLTLLAKESGSLKDSHNEAPFQELLSVAIILCANKSKWHESFDLLDELEASGAPTSHAVYKELVRACTVVGEWQHVSSLLERAIRQKAKPLVDIFSCAIAACDEAGNIDHADQIYSLGVDARVFRHWRQDSANSIDLHGFNQPCAAAAVRYALKYDIGNYIPQDLRIVTGAGKNSADGESKLRPRIERLLAEELQPPLPFSRESRIVCDDDQRNCEMRENPGCLLISVVDLLKWLSASKPYETYLVTIPS